MPYELYGGYGELVKESPSPAQAPRPLPSPEVEGGPHLAYAFQWFVFAVIAIVGMGLLARREALDAGDQPRLPDRTPARR